MRPITLVITFVLWPTIALGRIHPIEYDSVTNFPTFCENETIVLSDQTSLVLRRQFIASPSTKCINIKNSSPNIVAGSFDGFPNLIYLDLRGNDLSKSPNLFSFGNLSNVRVLKLGGEFPTGDPYYYVSRDVTLTVSDEYPELRYLDISGTHISDMQISHANPFPKITHLDLSRLNSPRSIDSFLSYMPPTLTHLDLTGSGVEDLSLWRMSDLLSLSLDENNFDSVRNERGGLRLNGLSKLVNLSIANNRISYINSTPFKGMVNLKYLNLSMNYLRYFESRMFEGLHLLEVLVLDGNLFDSVPFQTQLNITTLSLNCNHIKLLSIKSFEYVPRLRKLFLNGNGITVLLMDTSLTLSELEELHLGDNELSSIPPDLYTNLKKLNYLDLSGNKLTSLFHITGCPAKLIGLERNPIEYIDLAQLKTLPEYGLIYFNISAGTEKMLCPPKLRKSKTPDIDPDADYYLE